MVSPWLSGVPARDARVRPAALWWRTHVAKVNEVAVPDGSGAASHVSGASSNSTAAAPCLPATHSGLNRTASFASPETSPVWVPPPSSIGSASVAPPPQEPPASTTSSRHRSVSATLSQASPGAQVAPWSTAPSQSLSRPSQTSSLEAPSSHESTSAPKAQVSAPLAAHTPRPHAVALGT